MKRRPIRWTSGPDTGDVCQIVVLTQEPWRWMRAVRWWKDHRLSEIAVCTATWQAASVVNGASNDGGPFLFAFDLGAADDLTERLANVNDGDAFGVGDFPIAFVQTWGCSGEDGDAIQKQAGYFAKNTTWKPEPIYDPHPATLAGWAAGWWTRRRVEMGVEP